MKSRIAGTFLVKASIIKINFLRKGVLIFCQVAEYKWIEIEYHSIVYFECITNFDVLYLPLKLRAGLICNVPRF